MARFARPGAAKRPMIHLSIERYFGERSEAIYLLFFEDFVRSIYECDVDFTFYILHQGFISQDFWWDGARVDASEYVTINVKMMTNIKYFCSRIINTHL